MATSHHVPEMITPSKWDGWSFSKQPPPPSPTLQFNRFLGLEMTLTIFEKLKQNSRDWCIVKQHHPQIKGPCVRRISEDFSCMNWKFIRFRGWWLPLLCWYAMYTWQKMSSFFHQYCSFGIEYYKYHHVCQPSFVEIQNSSSSAHIYKYCHNGQPGPFAQCDSICTWPNITWEYFYIFRIRSYPFPNHLWCKYPWCIYPWSM